ncbi:alpha/beta hydrolase [Marinactinospora thermotolerans]|uniref:alpha/beta hydrolase n=1 Tax=Marinactinospora thermotolerans TaxID=531310 RepID=UPI003D8D6D77
MSIRRSPPHFGKSLRRLRSRAACHPAGLCGALLFFWLSLLPSLLPRPWFYQALLSGILATIGYALFRALWALAVAGPLRRVEWRPPVRGRRALWWLLVLAAGSGTPWMFWRAAAWQTELRLLMGMQSPGPPHYLLILSVGGALFAGLIVAGRLLRLAARILARRLSRWFPPFAAAVLGAAAVATATAWTIQYPVFHLFIGASDALFSQVDQQEPEHGGPPVEATRSAGPGSAVTWEGLGLYGREFVSRGPRAEHLSSFSGRPAADPIRVYAGLRSAPDPATRAELVVRELERTGGFSRSVLVVAATTGTGWVDPNAAASIEYLYNGDTAIAAVQYSYLPSWISFLADADRARASSTALFEAVHARWTRLPEGERPLLLLYGESLGVLGGEAAFDDIDEVMARTDGVLWVGPPQSSRLHSEVVARRNPTSPVWLPVYGDGEEVAFTGDGTVDTAGRPAVIYLQHPSDPIVLWSTDLLFSRPEWMDPPHGPDVSEDLRWRPIITWWQITADMAVSTRVPEGHGHAYGTEQLDSWLALTDPPHWTDHDTERLRDLLLHPRRSTPDKEPGDTHAER